MSAALICETCGQSFLPCVCKKPTYTHEQVMALVEAVHVLKSAESTKKFATTGDLGKSRKLGWKAINNALSPFLTEKDKV